MLGDLWLKENILQTSKDLSSMYVPKFVEPRSWLYYEYVWTDQ